METAYCLHPGPTWSVGVSLAHPSSDDGSVLNNCCHCASQKADLANICCQSTAVNALPQHSLTGKTATWSSTKVPHCAEFIQCSGSRIPRCTPDRLGQCQKECTPAGQPGASWNQPKPEDTTYRFFGHSGHRKNCGEATEKVQIVIICHCLKAHRAVMVSVTLKCFKTLRALSGLAKTLCLPCSLARSGASR